MESLRFVLFVYRRPLREKAAQTERQIPIYLSLSCIQYIIHPPFFQLSLRGLQKKDGIVSRPFYGVI